MNYLKYITTFSVLVLCFCKCHKDDPKPDPCAGKQAITADFTVHEYPYFPNSSLWEDYATDTLTSQCRFPTFKAVLDSTKGTTYTWEVGKSVYHNKDLVLDFSNQVYNLASNFVVPIKLTVTHPKDPCHPDLDTMRSFTKNVVWVPYYNTKLVGVYAGSWSGTKSNYIDTLIISNTKYNPRYKEIHLWYTTLMKNKTQKNDTTTIWNGSDWTYYSWDNVDGTGHGDYIGYKQVSYNGLSVHFILKPDNNTFNLTYYYSQNTNDGNKDLFTGKRIK